MKANDLVRIARPCKYSGGGILHSDGTIEEVEVTDKRVGKRAIIVASYADQFGGTNHNSFTLFVEGEAEVSWFESYRLELIESDQFKLLSKWRHDRQKQIDQWADIDWIFSHPESLTRGASLQALANCMGFGSLWGARGEGVDWAINARNVAEYARPFVEAGDQRGWFRLCEALKARHPHIQNRG